MNIVQRVDDTFEKELRQGPLRGVNAQIVFETPNSDWAARRSGLCVNLFLHSVEEDVAQRQSGETSIIDENGVVVGYTPPARFFKLGYALTVWGHSPRDEHLLFGTLLEWCVATEQLTPQSSKPTSPLTLKLRETPEGSEPMAMKLWPSLGTPARPVLDLLVTIPVSKPGTKVETEPIRSVTLRARTMEPPAPEDTPFRPPRPRGTARPRRRVEEIA
ncbi:Pvc16 family protein [Streptomyces violascens]|uniref:Pvc16 family protein n=1 Tax=Streptomyces violascens TaxID=67381 RepID=UPI0036C5EED1